MNEDRNALGQPIGFSLPDWAPRPRPPRVVLEGGFCILEPLDPAAHAEELFAANAEDRDGRIWTYLPYGPFGREEYRNWLTEVSCSADPMFYAIRRRDTGRACGVASYLRIDPTGGVIEVGHINYAPALQHSAAATEAMYLMMRHVFQDLGYRRYEWKCDALNAPSRAAALRLGFSYEGTFRQAAVYKQRNRDTAWYAAIDREWPALDDAFRHWLNPANFDAAGRQRRRLSRLTAEALGRKA